MKRKLLAIMVLGIGLGFAASARAGFISDRATLDGILGSSKALEPFETFNVANNSATPLNVKTLDSTTVTNGQGPGLVIPGFSLTTSGFQNLQWNGQGWENQPSKNVQGQGDSTGIPPNLTIKFNPATRAFGVDLLVFFDAANGLFQDNVTVRVYRGGVAGTLLGAKTFTVGGANGPSDVGPVFAGFQDNGTLDTVVLTTTPVDPTLGQTWSVNVDNLEFGKSGGGFVVPEPASLSLLGMGLMGMAAYRWRRCR